jgi:hypothetical protein
LHAAELPGREVLWGTGEARITSRSDLEQQLRARAVVARRELERIAGARRLVWSFEVRRARLSEVLREAHGLADVVTAELTGSFLALTDTGHPRRPVLAYYEGGACAERLLALAVRGAVQQDVPLIVLIPARSAEAAARPSAEVRGLLRSHKLTWQIERVPPGPAALERRVRRAPGQMLMLDAAGRMMHEGRLAPGLGAGGCQVVLVSPAPADSSSST